MNPFRLHGRRSRGCCGGPLAVASHHPRTDLTAHLGGAIPVLQGWDSALRWCVGTGRKSVSFTAGGCQCLTQLPTLFWAAGIV